MAYTVGSASVSIVPDFRNAQVEITRWFARQKDEIKVPVKPDVDETAARQAGSRMGRAMADGQREAQRKAIVDRETMYRQMFDRIERQEQKAARDAARAQGEITKSARDATRSREAMYRQMFDEIEQQERAAARDTERAAKESERALRESTKSREAAYREMFDEIERRERDSVREAEQAQRDIVRANRDAAQQRARIRDNQLRDEERYYREQARMGRDAVRDISRYLREEAKIQARVELDERRSLQEGRRHGGIIARAIAREFRENGGVIMAGLAAALIAGAPVALLAASAMFVGIAAAGVSQSQVVRQAWVGLWTDIKSGAQADAAVLIPTFTRMAGQIGQSFQRLRPQIRDAFVAIGPQIDSFTASLLQAGENAFPALVRAVQAGTPVVLGAGLMFERFGTGLGEFFDRLTANAPKAGEAFADLGGTFQVLLPLLGEVLAQGATLATMVLPALTGALSGALTVVDAMGSALPIMAAGFIAFRMVQGVGKMVQNWSQSLGMASIQGNRFSGMAGGAAGALSRVGRILPGVGIAVGLLATGMAIGEERTDKWTQALIKGGEAAAKARAEMSSESWVDKGIFATGSFEWLQQIAGWFGVGAKAADEAEREFDEYLASLTPLEKAQRDVDVAARALAEAMEGGETPARELERLQGNLAAASARLAREQEALEQATRGVTEAIAEQADQARARIDADFGYQKALLDVENSLIDVKDAQIALDEARAEGDPEAIIAAELGLREALLGVNEAYADQLSAANELATSNLPAAMDDNQKAILGYKAELDELNKLIEQGVVLPPSMEAYRQKLIEITGEADGAMLAQAQLAAAIGELGFSVEALPGTKAIEITAPTDELLQKLDALGFSIVTLPGGKVVVEPKTDEAMGALGDLVTALTGLSNTTATPGADIQDAPLRTGAEYDRRLLEGLDRQRPNPIAAIQDFLTGPTRGMIGFIDVLGNRRPRPTASINDQASGVIGSITRGILGIPDRSVTVTTNYVANYTSNQNAFRRAGGAAGGAIEDLPLQLVQKFDGGGAVIGRGSARDDLVPFVGPDPTIQYRAANGEHILDGRDVALMGGQAGVYAFREALNTGRLGGPGSDVSIQQMVATGQTARMPAVTGGSREVTILTQDNPRAIVRAIRADEQQQAALAAPW